MFTYHQLLVVYWCADRYKVQLNIKLLKLFRGKRTSGKSGIALPEND